MLLLFVSFTGMLCGLLVVFTFQLTGRFLPSSIVFQFDDDVTPALSTFSGTFRLTLTDGGLFDEGRVVYKNTIGDGSIGYCEALQAWTFGHSRSHYCDNIMALSQNPTTRDISLVLGQAWYALIGDDSDRLLPMESVYSAASCSDDQDCGGSERGLCEAFGCSCHNGFFGIWCNYGEHDICDTIKVDARTDVSKRRGREESHDFVALMDPDGKVVTAYDHPIYVGSRAGLNDSSTAVDVIVFAGLRWMLSSVFPPDSGLHTYFDSSFHASHSLLGPIEAVTEVVKFDTATDERPDPTSVSWFLPGSPDITQIRPVIGIDTIFTCSKCGPLYPCAFGNVCDGNGNCICENGETGSFCQISPVGDGQCDQFFNKRAFGYDGGDCCEGSCSMGAIHQCGIIDYDGLDGIPVGFPFCLDPSHTCAVGMNECWSRTSKTMPFLLTRSSRAFVTISGNGRTLVVSEPEHDTIRVFDHIATEWVQRGQTLEGAAKSGFGTFVAISTLPGVVVRRRWGSLPVVVAVGAVGNTSNYVEVYKFGDHANIWSLEGQRLIFNETIDSIAIGGAVLSLVVGLRSSNSGFVFKQNQESQWQIVFKASGSMVGLSGNGQIVGFLSTSLAVGESQGSGFFSLSELEVAGSYNPEAINTTTLPNLLPIELRTLSFQSRPIAFQLDYAGTYCIVSGRILSSVYESNGFVMIGLQRNATTFVTDRLAGVGFNISDDRPEKEIPTISLSSDARFLAINFQGSEVEMFDITRTTVVPESFQFLPNISDIPSFQVKGFEDTFAISDRGIVMAVVVNGEVEVVQRSPFCEGTRLRLAIILDDAPGFVSWSLDIARPTNASLPGTVNENIASCARCYEGNVWYSRAVVAEDVCIPKHKVGCVQLTFSVSGRHMGHGAGFVAFADGHPFARYGGDLETKAFAPGECQV